MTKRAGAATEDAGHAAARGARRDVAFREALRFWFKLGWISFGGPAGQIAIMHRELVERRRWLSEERFLHALNYCMMLPGPEAQQLAIYIGWLMHRTWGGIAAGALFVIPSVFILLALSYVYAAYGNVAIVAGVLSGFKPVVVAIVVEAVLKIGGRALKRRAHVLIAAASFVAIYAFGVPFPFIVLAAGLVGLAGSRAFPDAFANTTSPAKGSGARDGGGDVDDADAEELPLVIDDAAPPRPHTLPSRRRELTTLAVGLVMWALPLAAVSAWRGWDGLHSQVYRYFTKAALVTFGGAYAVLAYVTQAVTHEPYNWLTPAQAVDGLALAETTPGPLIMVLQFVGFTAGWNNPPSDLTQTASAVAAALITTYVTFLPCFLFILVGAPYIEVLRGNKNLTGALSGITASVVGVILNLALVFGVAVIWPRGFAGASGFAEAVAATNWFAAVMSVAAFVALYRLKADVLLVVIVGGLVGLLHSLFT